MLNPVFGLLSVVALMTALGQNQRILEHSKEELDKTNNSLKTQNEYIKKQAFEGTYFELLKSFNEVVSSIKKTETLIDRSNSGRWPNATQVEFSGRSVIDKLSSELCSEINRQNTGSRIIYIKNSYIKFHKKNENYIGRYYRFLFNVIRFIHESQIENKKTYTDILFAQMSNQELIIIFYYAISELGSDKMLPLLCEYNFLDHLSANELDEFTDSFYFKDL
jgi:hypothetical protein